MAKARTTGTPIHQYYASHLDLSEGQIQHRLKKTHSLIVDSVPDMLQLIGRHLAIFGAGSIDSARSAAEGLRKLQAKSVDILLCDVDLGQGYDGLWMLQEARAQNILKPSCVVLLLTG